jgi:ADP-heptose:LPS heptosyltransferase
VVAIAPGSRASSRRWDSNRFAAIANRLVGAGARVVVLGSSDEREITATVAGTKALDLGGRTDLLVLAAGLAESRLLICNDSGTMHLAAAVGTPTISLWGAGDPAVTGPVGRGHALVHTTALPCIPCVRNTCPRRGQGTVLPEAERECMALVSVDQVWEEVERRLRDVGM